MTVPQTEHQPDPQPRPAAETEPDVPPLAAAEAEPDLPPLPFVVRILLFALGTILVLVGIVFGPLPLVPAIVLVPLGAALLSLASNRLNRRLQAFVMRRWPNAWQRIQRVRAWLHGRLS